MKIYTKLLITATMLLSTSMMIKAQNSPFFIWGSSLDGSTYQKAAIYSESPTGLVFEAPKDASGTKLPIAFSWRGDVQSTIKILPNGYFGVNTTVPASRFSVNSGASAPTSRDLTNSITIGTGNANATSKYLGQIGFTSYDVDFNAPKMVAYISGEATETYSDNAKTGSVLRFFTGTNGGTNPVERMVINNSGNVGIGISSPAEKLAVNGMIRAKEVKVETDNWADYVFTKGYKLPSLQEAEQHIKEKGHLIGIPSAAEVHANGVELGNMNKKLLQKIEELTLYLIDMKKNSDQQQEQIRALAEKVDALKKN